MYILCIRIDAARDIISICLNDIQKVGKIKLIAIKHGLKEAKTDQLGQFIILCINLSFQSLM